MGGSPRVLVSLAVGVEESRSVEGGSPTVQVSLGVGVEGSGSAVGEGVQVSLEVGVEGSRSVVGWESRLAEGLGGGCCHWHCHRVQVSGGVGWEGQQVAATCCTVSDSRSFEGWVGVAPSIIQESGQCRGVEQC